MKFQLIRNATMRFSYGSSDFITDPFLAEKHAISSFAGRWLFIQSTISLNPVAYPFISTCSLSVNTLFFPLYMRLYHLDNLSLSWFLNFHTL